MFDAGVFLGGDVLLARVGLLGFFKFFGSFGFFGLFEEFIDAPVSGNVLVGGVWLMGKILVGYVGLNGLVGLVRCFVHGIVFVHIY